MALPCWYLSVQAVGAGRSVQLCPGKFPPEAGGESGLEHTLLSRQISCRSSFSPGALPA